MHIWVFSDMLARLMWGGFGRGPGAGVDMDLCQRCTVGETCFPKYLHNIYEWIVELYMLMMSSYSLHANDVIWMICKIGSKAKLFMQIWPKQVLTMLELSISMEVYIWVNSVVLKESQNYLEYCNICNIFLNFSFNCLTSVWWHQKTVFCFFSECTLYQDTNMIQEETLETKSMAIRQCIVSKWLL